MAVLDSVAEELKMDPRELIKESLRTYLEKRLSKVEVDIFLIAKKHGVKDVFDLDAQVKEGFITEKEAYEDYFALDNLEAERQNLLNSLEKI